MAEIQIKCNKCSSRYLVDRKHIGARVKCIECKNSILVSDTIEPTVPQTLPYVGGKLILPDLGLNMVPLCSGDFTCGSNDLYPEQQPTHKAVIKQPFWMSTTPISQKQYRTITGQNPSTFKGDNLPVESISWHQAQEFCFLLTEQQLISGSIKRGAEFRLPTEKEWEFAAGTITPDELPTYAWYMANSDGKTQKIASKKPNSNGLYDILGNVGEWCSDWYAPYGELDPTREFGPAKGTRKVRRGGSWGAISPRCTTTDRIGLKPEAKSSRIGFRIVLTCA